VLGLLLAANEGNHAEGRKKQQGPLVGLRNTHAVDGSERQRAVNVMDGGVDVIVIFLTIKCGTRLQEIIETVVSAAGSTAIKPNVLTLIWTTLIFLIYYLARIPHEIEDGGGSPRS
jgi:hypothetical protein